MDPRATPKTYAAEAAPLLVQWGCKRLPSGATSPEASTASQNHVAKWSPLTRSSPGIWSRWVGGAGEPAKRPCCMPCQCASAAGRAGRCAQPMLRLRAMGSECVCPLRTTSTTWRVSPRLLTSPRRTPWTEEPRIMQAKPSPTARQARTTAGSADDVAVARNCSAAVAGSGQLSSRSAVARCRCRAPLMSSASTGLSGRGKSRSRCTARIALMYCGKY
jgi:hypothetical protein